MYYLQNAGKVTKEEIKITRKTIYMKFIFLRIIPLYFILALRGINEIRKEKKKLYLIEKALKSDRVEDIEKAIKYSLKT